MIGLLQRVSSARVSVAGQEVAGIGRGILVLVGVQRGDGAAQAVRLAERLVHYRVFPDADGRMNLSVKEAGGEILLVPQFTLAANTRKGTRASFARAADPADGKRLYERLQSEVEALHAAIVSGIFGADMQVSLVNDGPVTFWLEAGGSIGQPSGG